MPRDNKCQKCELHRGVKNVCVWGEGPPDASVMVIGEAPGYEEDKGARPFIGRSGQLMRSELQAAGITNVYITNMVKCRPPDNDKPTNDQLKACREYIEEEIATIKPKYILTMGATPSKALLRKSKITQDHGLLVDMPNFQGMPVYHPAYILRDPSKLPAFRHDLQRFARHQAGNLRTANMDWEIVTFKNVGQFMRDYLQCSAFAFDTETTSLFPHDGKGRVRCLQLSLDRPEKTYVLPLAMNVSWFRKPEAQLEIVKFLTENQGDRIAIAANGKFDNTWLQFYYGVRFYLNDDVGLMHYVLDENSPHGLKEQTRSVLDEPDYDLSLKEKLSDDNPAQLFEYGARDAFNTRRIRDIHYKQIIKDRTLRRLYYRLLMRSSRALQNIEMRGLTVNLDKFEKARTSLMADKERLLGELNKMAGETINWNSPVQVAHILFDKFKLVPAEFTEGGAPSTGEATLVAIKDQHPIANTLVKYRETEKFLGTYLEGWREYMVGNKIYFSYKIHGTVTGRFSCRLHQVPRDGTIRNLIEAPPGWVFVQADISQAELRIVAHVANELELINCFKRRIDVHWRTLLATITHGGSGEYVQPARDTASKLANRKIHGLTEACSVLLEHGHEKAIEVWKGWKEGRKKAKGINFGFVYGMREPKFIEYAKLKYGFEPTLEEATLLRNAYFNLYRGLEPWHKKQRNLVHLNGYVRTLSGRMRRLPGIRSSDRSLSSEAERQAVNSPIQGFIGDYKAMVMCEIDEELPHDQVQIVGEVHDALLMIIREDVLDYWAPVIRNTMRHPKALDEFKIELNVPMEADLEIGPWGAGKAYKFKGGDSER